MGAAGGPVVTEACAMDDHATIELSTVPVAEDASAPPEPVIRFVDVYKSLGGRPVLRGVNLTVYRGEALAIIGGSGQGKTVTLKHIEGILKADRGRVTVDGTDLGLADEQALDRVRAKIGFCFQGAALRILSAKESWITAPA